MVDTHWLRMLPLFTQLLLLILALVGWGSVLGRHFAGEQWSGLPLYRRTGIAWIILTLCFGLTGFLSVLVGPITAKLLVIAFFLAGGIFALPRLRRLARADHFAPWEKSVVLLIGIFAVSFAALSFFSFVPGPLVIEYGDLPAYYRVATNLQRGGTDWFDFWIGDYENGIYRLPLQYPLPTLVMATFEHLFPRTWMSLGLYSILTGLCALFYGVGFACHKLRKIPSPLGAVILFVFILAPAGVLQHLALGGITVAPLLFFLVLIDLLDSAWLTRGRRAFLIFLTMAVTFLFRPEGALFLVCFLSLFAVSTVAPRMWGWSRAGTFALGALFTISLYWIVPAAALRVLGKAPSLYFLHFNTPYGEIGQGVSRAVGWAAVNHDNAREALGLPRQLTALNDRVWSEAYAHARELLRFYSEIVCANLGERNLIFVGFLALFAAMWGPSVVRLCFLSVLLYVPIITAININASVRHVWPLLVLLIVGGYLSVWRSLLQVKWTLSWLSPAGGRILGWAVFLTVCGLCAADAWATTLLRLDPNNFKDFETFERVKPHLTPGSRIATTYPQLSTLYLDRPSYGCSNLEELVEPVADKFAPDFILLRATTRPLRKLYDDAFFGRMQARGYRVFEGTTHLPFLILRKEAPVTKR